jgi:diaminohydroxyphosphoribosylaminopyrimidine deaminase/5-amino-6-(5-phosphoribosylamino)uracil reductase
MRDPFPRVAGGGFAQLRAAGVDVECGLCEAEARELNRGYLKAITQGLPWVTLKMAVTLDGKTATRTGDSRWVTGEAARRYVHRLRDWNDAVLIGIGTARADDPALTARLPRARNPVRVVVDARVELSPGSILARTARETPTLLGTVAGANTRSLEALGVETLPAPASLNDGREQVDLEALLRALVKRGIQTVLCEGGATLAGALLDAGLVDEIAWFVAPKLVGDRDAPGAVSGAGVMLMAQAPTLLATRTRRFGDDVGIFGYLHPPGQLPDEPLGEEREKG